jgi:hypothetical protein
MSKLHSHFTKTVVINLDRRVDRMKKVSHYCRQLGIEFQRVSACDGRMQQLQIPSAVANGFQERHWNQAAAGLCLTVAKILKEAKAEGCDSVLFLEDDVEFRPDVNEQVAQSMPQVPADWEMIYVGISHLRPGIPISEHVVRIICGMAAHCVAIRCTVFDLLIEALSKPREPIDVTYANKIHPRGRSYAFEPRLAYQAVEYSDITGEYVNYTFLHS